MYAITGASGNIGKHITELLLSKGAKVRVIGRNPQKLQPLVEKGAEMFIADMLDTSALTKAFTGAKAVYVLLPPNYSAKDFHAYQNKIGESIAKAIKNSGVKHVVNLSSVGANLGKGVGVVNGLHDQEERLNKLKDVDVLHLRPSFFMENNFMQIDIIKNMGVMGSPQNPDKPLPQIATSDIAEYAAGRLLNLDFKGKSTHELLGSRDVTMKELAKIYGHAIGRDDLKFVQFSYDDTRKALIGKGLSESVADGMIELYKAFNEDRAKPLEKRSDENTTHTTPEEFSKTFAEIYTSN